MDTESKLDILQTGLLGVNTYIITHQKQAFVVDPGGNAEKIIDRLGDSTLTAVLLTHAHFDHIGGIDALLAAVPGARFLCHPLASSRAGDAAANLSVLVGEPLEITHPAETVTGGAELLLAGVTVKTFFIPGHTPDHLCYYLPEEGWLFAGDTVFAGGIGRSDFPGGDGEMLVRSIREMLTAIPPETQIYPGHGGATTADSELCGNPYLSV